MKKRVNIKKVVGVLGVVALLLGIEFYSIAIAEKPVQKPVLPGQASEKAKVTLEKVWEKQFDEKIKSFTWERGKKGLVVTDSEVILLNENGQRTSKQSIFVKGWAKPYVWSSANEEYVGVSFLTAKTEDGKKKCIEKFALWNKGGKKLWETDKGFRDGFAVSNRGRVVDGNVDDDGKMDFYDVNGRVIKQVSYAENLGQYAGWNGMAFSSDGKYFIITGNTGAMGAKIYLVLYNESGLQLWKKMVEGNERYREVNISKAGNFSAVNKIISRKGMYVNVFDKQGNLLWERQIGKVGDRIFLFSEDEKYLLIGSSENRLYLFKTQDGKLLWEFSETNLESGLLIGFISLDISVDNKNIIVGGFSFDDYGVKQRYVYLFDFNGKMIWKQEYEKGEQRKYTYPSVKFVTPTEFNVVVSDKAFNYVIHQK